ncbi:MAG: CpaF family protein, partial [Hydrogenovibrio sp.]|nr:CpaF family protein [Hydrogenovibrio sp.]
QIASAIDIIIYVNRGRDGKRRVESVTEVLGVEEDNVVLQEIYRFENRMDPVNERFYGVFKATGLRPSCGKKCESIGISMPESLFNFEKEVV